MKGRDSSWTVGGGSPLLVREPPPGRAGRRFRGGSGRAAGGGGAGPQESGGWKLVETGVVSLRSWFESLTTSGKARSSLTEATGLRSDRRWVEDRLKPVPPAADREGGGA